MAPSCPRCRAPVGDDDLRCAGCGAELDPHRTALPAGSVGRATARDAQPARAIRKRTPEPAASEDSPPDRPARPRRRASAKSTESPRPAYPPPRQTRPADPGPSPSPSPPVRPTEPAPTPSGSYYQPASYLGVPALLPQAPPAGLPQQGRPGFFRGLLITLLGGNVATPPASLNPQLMPLAPMGYPPPGSSPAAPAPAPAAGYWPADWSRGPTTPAPPAQPAPAAPIAAAGPASPLDLQSDKEEWTEALKGVDLDRLRIPKQRYSIQILDSHGEWRDWGPIPANGLNIGRAKHSADFPGLASMAVRHLRLGYDRDRLVVEDLGSLNGVYVRLAEPIELDDGMRFRVGSQVIEFRRADPFEPEPPLRSEDDEVFYSRDPEPLAYLDLIRPNGRPGLRFPITRRTPTVIGRAGQGVDVALTDDKCVSAPHAQIRVDDGQFVLDDLESRNGTFVHVLGSRPLNSGDVILAGKVLFRVVDSASGLA